MATPDKLQKVKNMNKLVKLLVAAHAEDKKEKDQAEAMNTDDAAALHEGAEQVEMKPVEIEAEMDFPVEADKKDDAVNNASTGLKYTPVND